MTDKQQNVSNDDDSIAPAKVALSAQPRGADASSADASVWRQHRLAILGLGLALAALLAVVFLLPELVAPVETPKATTTAAGTVAESSAAENAQAPRAQGPSESPWQDAQFAKARREAQAVLEKLLEKQEALEEIRVDLWAGDEFASAQNAAKTADQHYRSQEFMQAQALYENSLEQFEQLLDRSAGVFESAVSQGEQAIVDGDADLAQESFELAAHIKPDSEAVKDGLQRTAVLEDVLAEIEAGDKLKREAELEAAKQRYQAALNLDEQSQIAQQRLRDIEGAIADNNFGASMSVGFSAMSTENYQEAIDAFQKALAIRPDAGDARNALKQAQNEKTQTQLSALLSQAQQHEQNEEWQAAVDKYQQALDLDKNLVEARVGAIRAGARAEVDKNLQGILESPKRLTTPAVHQDYQAFYQETLNISNPGPRLSRQLKELQEALKLAVQPVTVELRSDNATQVTVYKVGQLGSFAATELTLKPGTYTAVGSRQGFRDVRQEFTVSPDADRSPITIQCVEKIPKG